MSIENLQPQIEALQTRIADLNVYAGAAGQGSSLVELLEEMSTISNGLLGANVEVSRRLAIQSALVRIPTESISQNEAYDKVLQAVCEVTGGELGILWIYNPNIDLLHPESMWQVTEKPGNELAHVSSQLTFSPGEGLPGSVYRMNKPLWIPDIGNHPNVRTVRKEAALESWLKNALVFPIRKKSKVMGVIECFSRQFQQPSLDLLEMLDVLGNQIGGFMERKYAEDLLAVRVHQQAVVATIGQRALLGVEIQKLLDEASELVAKTLAVEFSKILELIHLEERLLLRAGIGWRKGLVGHAYVEVGPRSQGGCALSTNSPVIVSDLSKETRFHPSSILVEHEVVSGLSVIIPGRLKPFGILSAHSSQRRTFTEDDMHFLQAVAHVLAAAIQRQEAEEALRLSRHEIAVILDGIADGITAQNENGKVVYANDAAARIVGFPNAIEFMNSSIDQVFPKFAMFDEDGAPLPVERLPGRLALMGLPSSPVTIRFKILETGEERWSVVKAKSVVDEDGQVVMAVNIFQDITDLKRTELAQRLLAEASSILDTSLNYETRLTNLAELIVPRLADWCSVDILDENQILQRVAVTHIDPQKVAWAHELHRRYPPNPKAARGAYNIIRTNRSEYVPFVTSEMIESVPDPELKEITRKLAPTSIIQVPLFVRGNTMGVLGLVWAESGYHYTPADLALAEDLGRRAALALDNARLYMEAQRLNTELEQRVEKRTVQLQKSNLRLKEEIKECKQGEKQIRSLNAVLEQRVIERTRQLENTNQELQHQIVEREQADKALELSLQKTRELYEISQKINLMRIPEDVLKALLSSSYLKSALRAAVVTFDTVWQEGGIPPERGTVLAEWNQDSNIPTYAGTEFTLSESGLVEFYSRYEPLILSNIVDDPRIAESARPGFLELGIKSSVFFPLVAGGERYGMLIFHFAYVGALNSEDTRYLRGLVDQTAMAIYNFRLLEAEARARREAEEANNLKLKFLAMISHELRTPLTSIKGFATTLLADDVQWEAESQRDFLETIDVEADKLTDLIEQLLDLSRLEADTMRIVTQRVIWDEVLSTAMAQLKVLTVNHMLVVEEEPGLPPLKVDVIRVPQVITNLVSNAVKYSPPHTKITISAAKLSDQFIKVCVLDKGSGIPPEARSRVFEAFQQLEQEKGGMRGAGLGLAICRGLLEAHGGHIWVDEHTGPGTTISFTLPVD
jgi:two-component system sensor histidine kinase BarA